MIYMMRCIGLSGCCYSSQDMVYILKWMHDLYVRMYTRTTHVEVRTFTEELLFFTSIVEHKEYAN